VKVKVTHVGHLVPLVPGTHLVQALVIVPHALTSVLSSATPAPSGLNSEALIREPPSLHQLPDLQEPPHSAHPPLELIKAFPQLETILFIYLLVFSPIH
jgi:hypothetical protein